MANYLELQSSDLNYNPNPLLDAIKEHLNLKNGAALSRILEVAPPVISKIRHAKLPVGATLLISMHEVTHIKIKKLRALMGDRRPSSLDFGYCKKITAKEHRERKQKDESELLVALYHSMNPADQAKLLQFSQRLVKLSDLTEEKTMTTDDVMTGDFDDETKEPFVS